MEGKYPLLIDGRESGELRVTRRGALTLFEAEAEDGGGILRLDVYKRQVIGYILKVHPDAVFDAVQGGQFLIHSRLCLAVDAVSYTHLWPPRSRARR